MPTPLPASTDYTAAANQLGKKTFMTSVRAFLADLLGTSGTAADARAALGAAAASHGHTAAEVGAASASHTHTAAEVGAAASVEVDALRDIAANPQIAAYTLALTDRGKSVDILTGGVTVPPNSSVAFGIGSTTTITNTSSSSQTITQGTGVTLRQAGTTNTGNRTLAGYGMVTLRKVATDEWFISGAGLT